MTGTAVPPTSALGSDTPATVPGPTAGAGARGVARVGRELRYLIGGLPLSIVAFVVAIAGFAAGVSTVVVWVGVPVLAATLRATRGLARVERRSTETVLGRPLPPHHYRTPSGTGLGRMVSSLAEPQSWRDLLHAVVGFPVRLTCFIVGVVWAATGLGSALAVTWMWSLPYGDDGVNGLYGLLTGADSRFVDIAITTVAGLVLLAALPWVLRLLVAARAGLARGLLTNQSAALRARAAQLAASRRAAVAAEAQTLRRLERDIHDGPQQRLVRLTMDLEAVTRRLDDDPDRARALVAEALAQSREALTELRALSRGIAPPILADRGLGAALAAAAARSPVEVSLDVALPDGRRLADEVENAAYFVVTEALTNVAKHSAATLCTVTVTIEGSRRRDDARVVVTVTDDGVGGAHLGKGHGLAGLADRLSGVDGMLDLSSPPGGPTVLTATIPLLSDDEGST
ncbi:MAG: sensor domain-containing protein [Pseudonocardia sp.]|uniref:sensor histidine kinase n=1 Tax=unclassified Pseudonocardia TaxID=2619320 RepID=UPI00086F7976|nr:MULTISPECIES: sensor histidine kinase [unclassified Pseudonocardia]MBN9110535.1 sensor domain-containing protein [Pseudonocardia sp.]ODU19089.1 MAG: histidine kinase [Pseudonocardia sp. SCN 72-51]ODV00689.1 MAG: histidine kinase [Pseudonocardia sp. SCN 73-27]